MKLLAAGLLAARVALGAESLNVFGYRWTVPDSADWKVTEQTGSPMLQLLVGREPPVSGPRRPTQFAIADTTEFSKVRLDADVKPLGKSLIIVFGFRDSAHFDYAHLSIDTATTQANHNGVFHVYGGERVRISSDEGPAAFPVNKRWYQVVLAHDGTTGAVQVDVDGRSVPALHAVDLSLPNGRIGIGSFDETAEFKNVVLHGK